MKGVTCPALLDPERPGAPSPGQWENLSVQSLLGTTLVVWSCPHCCCGFQYKQKDPASPGTVSQYKLCHWPKGNLYVPCRAYRGADRGFSLSGRSGCSLISSKTPRTIKSCQGEREKVNKYKNKNKSLKKPVSSEPTPMSGEGGLKSGNIID